MKALRLVAGWTAIVAGVGLALASLILGGQSRGPDSDLERLSSTFGMGPDLFAWALGAVGILTIAGGWSLLGSERR